MKIVVRLFILIIPIFVFGQTKTEKPLLDINTIYATIDTLSYSKLFENSFIKDTLFFCKNANSTTNKESYSGKYFIGNGATIEFFEPMNTTLSGDTFGDIGIEFKTRRINQLQKFKNNRNQTDTTYAVYDSIKIPWYVSLKSNYLVNHTEIVALEYQKEYLVDLGFSEQEINSDMTYEQYNAKLSGGRKYPRKFNSIKSIELNLERKEFENLKKTIVDLGGKFIDKLLILNGFEIKCFIKKQEHFRLKKIVVDLLEEVPDRKIKISDLISVEAKNKIAVIKFKT